MGKIAVENVNRPGSIRSVDAAMYRAMKRAWLRVLPITLPGLSEREIQSRLIEHLPATLFPDGAKAGWWSKTVQLDLEAKGLVMRNKTRPLRWHRGGNKTSARRTNDRDHPKRIAPTTFDEYIAAFPVEVQVALRKIRSTVARTAPGAVQTISYGIPAFSLNGMLVYFAAFKHHIGLYPPIKGDAALNRAIQRYRGEKGNLRLPLDEPMPYALITRIVKARIAEQVRMVAAKRSSRTRASHS